MVGIRWVLVAAGVLVLHTAFPEVLRWWRISMDGRVHFNGWHVARRLVPCALCSRSQRSGLRAVGVLMTLRESVAFRHTRPRRRHARSGGPARARAARAQLAVAVAAESWVRAAPARVRPAHWAHGFTR